MGKSTKNPILRAEQLSKQTSASGQFKVEWYMEVPDIDIAENICHYKLKEFHYNKEYFKVELGSAKQILTQELIVFFKLENSDLTVFFSEKKILKPKEALELISKIVAANIKAKEMIKRMENEERMKKLNSPND